MSFRKNKKIWIALLSIAVIVLILTGCSLGDQAASETATPAPNDQQNNLDQVGRELEMMQSLWESQDLDDYRFQFQWNCFCTTEYIETVWVTVEDGEITSIEAVDPNFEGELPAMSEYRTINGLFDLIREGTENQAYQIQVSYNDTFGYPASAYIDYDMEIVDEERGFSVREVQPLTAAPAETPQSTDSDSENLVTRTNIYLIAVDDNGQSGKQIGCNDSVVPVEIEIEPTAAPLTAALTRLLDLDSQYYGQSGLYNVFYQSDLEVESIDIIDGEAVIRLSGNLLLGGVCDEPRVKAQIEETALQFSTVSEVSIYINGDLVE